MKSSTSFLPKHELSLEPGRLIDDGSSSVKIAYLRIQNKKCVLNNCNFLKISPVGC